MEKASRFVPAAYFEALKESRRPQRGDILFSVTGSIGIPAMVDTDSAFTFQRHIAILRPDHSKISSSYLKFVLDAEGVQQQALAVATGTAQLTIPLTGLRSFQIEVRSMEEQTEIVRRVDLLFEFADRIEARYKTARAQVEKLTPATLAKAFRGELVPQDPNDEPASLLLERIRAARAAEEKTGKPQRRKAPVKIDRKSQTEVNMLELSKVNSDHLTTILNEKGRLAPKVLWQASQLGIEDFYEQLRTGRGQTPVARGQRRE